MKNPPGCRDIGAASALLRSLDNPNRLAIICLLLEGERSVMELEVALGIHQPTLSQQLTALRDAGMIAGRRSQKHVIYRVVDARAAAVVGVLRQFFSELLPASSLLATARPGQDRESLAAAVAAGRMAEWEAM